MAPAFCRGSLTAVSLIRGAGTSATSGFISWSLYSFCVFQNQTGIDGRIMHYALHPLPEKRVFLQQPWWSSRQCIGNRRAWRAVLSFVCMTKTGLCGVFEGGADRHFEELSHVLSHRSSSIRTPGTWKLVGTPEFRFSLDRWRDFLHSDQRCAGIDRLVHHPGVMHFIRLKWRLSLYTTSPGHKTL